MKKDLAEFYICYRGLSGQIWSFPLLNSLTCKPRWVSASTNFLHLEAYLVLFLDSRKMPPGARAPFETTRATLANAKDQCQSKTAPVKAKAKPTSKPKRAAGTTREQLPFFPKWKNE